MKRTVLGIIAAVVIGGAYTGYDYFTGNYEDNIPKGKNQVCAPAAAAAPMSPAQVPQAPPVQ